MKKLLLFLTMVLCHTFNSKAQTEGWTNMLSPPDDGYREYANAMHYNGKIYITGGDNSGSRVDTWEYTIANKTWVGKADMPGDGYFLSGHTSIGSKLFIVGGYRNAGNVNFYTNAFRVYDAAEDTWNSKAPFPGGELMEIGVLNINGEIYAGGGYQGNNNPIFSNSFYKYDMSSNTWSILPTCPSSGTVLGSFTIGNMGYFIFGQGEMYAYDPINFQWIQKKTVPGLTFGSGGAGTSNTFVEEGKAYLVADLSPMDFYGNAIQKYDPVTDNWSYLTKAPFNKQAQIVVNTGEHTYIGFGRQTSLQTRGPEIQNDWYRLDLKAPLATTTGTFQSNCTESGYYYNDLSTLALRPDESKTFTDLEGNLFTAVQAGEVQVNEVICIKQVSLSAPLVEKEILISDSKYKAMLANKNFELVRGNISMGTKLRMYFTNAELNSLLTSFNNTYGTNKSLNDIKIAERLSNDTLENYKIYTTTLNDYNTSDKYLEFTSEASKISLGSTVYAIIYTESKFDLPENNFIVTTSEGACKGQGNGKGFINIAAAQELDYTAVITGKKLNQTQNFTNNLVFSSLPEGNYDVCITVAGQSDYRKCLNINITEPQNLSVNSFVTDNKLNLLLDGSDAYQVEFNKKVYYTKENQIAFDLVSGNNMVKVSTNNTRQGVVVKQFYIKDQIKFHPNPFVSDLNLEMGSHLAEKTRIEIKALDGSVVFSQQLNKGSDKLTMDLSKLRVGLYVVKVSSGNKESVHRIMKN